LPLLPCMPDRQAACLRGRATHQNVLFAKFSAASSSWLVVQYAQLECPWQTNCTQGRGEGWVGSTNQACNVRPTVG
jgi:hypothetical protein